MLKKLMALTVASVNVGYTLFLFPLLGILYPERVPLTFYNLAAFTLVNSAWGLILALLTYAIMRVSKMNLPKAITLSIATLWALYWALSSLRIRTLSSSDLIILGLDGAAALIVWATVLTLAKRCGAA